MATNKELVEQAVKAIPQWMAFLEKKEAEQKLILEQMQDDETQFAPKTLTERLTDRFKGAPQTQQPENQVKLEKEPIQEEEVIEEREIVEEENVTADKSTQLSSNQNKQQISNEEFSDIF